MPLYRAIQTVERTFIFALSVGFLLTGCATQLPTVVMSVSDVANGAQDTAPADGKFIYQSKKAHTADLRAKSHEVLILTSGGADGAFGAGALVSWTRSGRRPVFDVVSGVSTGAL
jgi:hypothetical protein